MGKVTALVTHIFAQVADLCVKRQVLALATVQAAILDRAYFFRVAARQHLGHQAIVIRRLVARMGLLKRLPVVSKDRLEDIPVPRGGCHHRIAPSGGDQSVAMERLYHASAASSTPHPASLRDPHPTRLSLMNESFRDRKNAFSYTIEKQLWLSLAYYHLVLPHQSLRERLPTPEPTRGAGSPRTWRPVTPAMAAGLTDHVWTTDELLIGCP